MQMFHKAVRNQNSVTAALQGIWKIKFALDKMFSHLSQFCYKTFDIFTSLNILQAKIVNFLYNTGESYNLFVLLTVILLFST
jgi:hypothetical protein